MNEFRNAVGCRFNHIRSLNVQFLAILEKSVRIEFCHFHDSLVLTLGAF